MWLPVAESRSGSFPSDPFLPKTVIRSCSRAVKNHDHPTGGKCVEVGPPPGIGGWYQVTIEAQPEEVLALAGGDHAWILHECVRSTSSLHCDAVVSPEGLKALREVHPLEVQGVVDEISATVRKWVGSGNRFAGGVDPLEIEII